jgi:hypothetical protein
MDGDDISLPERFEKQIAFLEKYPGIDIVGSAVKLIDERGRTIGVLTTPFDDLAIHWASIFSASFIHPTIMLRHSVLIDHKIQYMASRKQPEDYVFFAQLLEYAHGANFTKPLLLYRIHPASVTSHSGRDNINRKSILIYTNLKKHFPALAISHDQVLNVSGALLGRPPMFWKRAQAADTYLRVWQVFSERCNPDPAFYRLRTNVVLIAAKLALYPPFQPGSQKVIRRIFEIEPKWFPSFLRKFPGMVSTKIQTILIRHNRK